MPLDCWTYLRISLATVLNVENCIFLASSRFQAVSIVVLHRCAMHEKRASSVSLKAATIFAPYDQLQLEYHHWTSKMSLKPTIDKALENIQRTYIKLKWMKGGRTLSKEILRKCFFA